MNRSTGVYNYVHAWDVENLEDDGVFDRLQLGKPVPELSGETLDGTHFSLAEQVGKYVIIEFGCIT